MPMDKVVANLGRVNSLVDLYQCELAAFSGMTKHYPYLLTVACEEMLEDGRFLDGTASRVEQFLGWRCGFNRIPRLEN